ncbi:DUF1272 domain-containing protein [Nocardia sp. NPDC023988]|uniref:DUF1272 domain-containing protein n=1 Tax=unclassified Nocardia TaxID=2637762 RepID=UPI0033DADE4F
MPSCLPSTSDVHIVGDIQFVCEIEGVAVMLKMKSTCETCAAPLRDDAEAFICSYECTYCPACTADHGVCPNCAGELVRRPRRATGVAEIVRRAPARLRRKIQGTGR